MLASAPLINLRTSQSAAQLEGGCRSCEGTRPYAKNGIAGFRRIHNRIRIQSGSNVVSRLRILPWSNCFPALYTCDRGTRAVTVAAAGDRSSDVAAAHPDILSVVYSQADIAEAVCGLGRQLAAEYADKSPLLLGALTGAFMFTADLARAMAPPPAGLAVDFFSASSYGAATVADGDVKLEMGGKIPVAGRHVIVVEDIIDTGMTLQRVMARLKAAGAASVKVAVLLDKAERRKVAIQPDYCALSCPNDFVVGYGLDFNEEYRSLPYVGVLRPECYAHLANGDPH